MSQAQMLRQHHRSLLEMAHELERGLEALDVRERRQRIVHCLSRMSGLLALHLAMEDKGLYPRLLAQSDQAVVETARRFFDEVGGFKRTFEDYRRRWMRPEAFESSWGEFAAESRMVLRALRDRIQREDRDIHQLMEALGI